MKEHNRGANAFGHPVSFGCACNEYIRFHTHQLQDLAEIFRPVLGEHGRDQQQGL